MRRHGILVDYEYCTGCRSCEMACRVEHGFADGQGGVALAQVGPYEYADGKYEFDFSPVLTDQCDLCAERTGKGKLPACVHHCQAQCMEYGEIGALAEKLGESGGKATLLVA